MRLLEGKNQLSLIFTGLNKINKQDDINLKETHHTGENVNISPVSLALNDKILLTTEPDRADQQIG